MLEQIAYQLPRIFETKQRVYQVRDLEFLSASALHYGEGGGSSGFVGGVFGGINKKDMNKYGIVLPVYSTPSKIFIPEAKAPLLRYDPADKTHSQGHLHIGGAEEDFPALKIDEEDAVNIYVEAWLRNIIKK